MDPTALPQTNTVIAAVKLSAELQHQKVRQKGLFSEYGHACYINMKGQKIRGCLAHEHTVPRFIHHARQERRCAMLLEAIELASKKRTELTTPEKAPEYPNRLM